MITKFDVLRRPLLTEKSMQMQENGLNTVVFQVHPEANKVQIKEAVEELLNVKVEAVRTMNFKGKEKRFGRIMGRRQNWKKAIVTLKEGESLNIV